MRNAVITDMKEYVKKYGKLILLSIVTTIYCFGFLAFSGNIRIDTEELMNNPGSTLGWLTIGRFSLAFFKSLLGLGTFSAEKSSLLFLLFFIAGANLLTFAFYHFSGKNEKYPYWVFMLLYCTSNIWSFQIYFSLQQAEVALAMLLAVAAAILAMETCFGMRGWRKVIGFLVSTGLLVLVLGAYQALAAYYIAVCVALFLLFMEYKTETEKIDAGLQTRGFLRGIMELMMQFGISYLVYGWIADNWFMATEGYMQSQKGWGRMPVADCIHAVLLTGKNVLLGYGPRNFSFFTAGVLLTAAAIFFFWKKKRYRTKAQLVLYLLAMAGFMFTPFLMTLYMGEMLVTRSQFALPVVAAFLGMYGIGHLQEFCGGKCPKRSRAAKLAAVFVIAMAAVQISYNLRLAYTDDVRYAQDVELTEQVLASLEEANGGEMPEKPVVFVGYRVPEYNRWCARTEMYGWSFYEWDYSMENPTGATHRIAGFIQAYSGIKMNEAVSDEMRKKAVDMARSMPDFPEEGAVEVTDEFVVVRLSEVTERTDVSWW